MITIELPRALGPYAGDRRVVKLAKPCATVAEALADLGRELPGVLDRVLDERGAVRPHVNVFVNEKNVRFERGLGTPLPPDGTIHIVAAVSGG